MCVWIGFYWKISSYLSFLESILLLASLPIPDSGIMWPGRVVCFCLSVFVHVVFNSESNQTSMCKSALLLLLGLSLGLVESFPSQEPDGGKHWVVIVAGSNGWYNYRHQVRTSVTKASLQPVKRHLWQLFVAFTVFQADACHAYQIVHRNGIPDEQVVVMMYDDLAENEMWVDLFSASLHPPFHSSPVSSWRVQRSSSVRVF